VGDGGADHDGVEKATVIIDEQAADKLRLADEYRHTWANKPSWQSWR
jgi:glucosamine-6-phosphate deaminase